MQSSQPAPSLRENEIADIVSYVRIAELHGTHLSLTEALRLTSTEMSEEELARAWAELGNLSLEYTLRSGRFVSRRVLQEAGHAAIEARLDEGRRRVAANMQTARSVWRVFSKDGLKMFAVSGGNSYEFARQNDDIDVFCVTKTGSLWPFVLKHLLVSRFYAIFRKDIPRLCFSYILDEESARREFSEPKDRLFARDALSLKVVEGHDFFVSLLKGAGWMKELFPKSYAASVGATAEHTPETGPSTGARILNLFLFRTVGLYIRAKSILDNARNRKRGASKFVNRLSADEGYVLFESRKYQGLRGMYATNRSGRRPEAPQTELPRPT